ncbi:MAG: ribonuclease Y [Fusobacterium gastrosuis]|uniref:ribonuclease Y n=1 Tax=Fusobacterium TaxID=848 RepID=UPI001F4F7B75|nr:MULTISPECIES: ribonuclease Y [Fusobacterium]MDD7392727.1 ribonuclease Y [Fusobacteriaceae bacterium]MCI5724913.1 ribonuclease Y [Fusobacterium sp.]MDD7409715.1 ribonuclease Y [Fusobacteriaceae bacterium]MDY4010676.1 ribonuclease Y [Fusobacterium gastrosuis]MDY5305737.1 ribonuclease Y [Fusobacterium gastrosuis]
MNSIILIGVVAFLAIAIIFSVIYKKSVIDRQIEKLNDLEDEVQKAKIKAKEILEEAEKDAHSKAKEIEIKAKEKAYQIKEEAEKDAKNMKNEIAQKEARIIKKEETLDNKIEKLENKSLELEKISEELEVKKEEVEILRKKEEEELTRISELSKEEARDILLNRLKGDLSHDMAVTIREFENKIEEEKDKLSQKILSTAIGKAAADYVADATVSVINLPNDEMKGRIIGREGRNIRTIEALTGVDVIIDDTPEAVVLSCFDGVKREVARLTIEKLITDGRIHPGKIEEIVNKCKRDVEKEIIAAGEEALIELSIPSMHPEIIKTLGRLKYRTSYGQNVLTHSIEVAKIASTLAAEIGADVELAKRGGLLHDIGKVLVNEIETSHAIVGGEFVRKFGEKQDVVNAVMAHHNEVEFETVEAILVQAADAVSASRPGARRETLTAYIKRLENLEEIANSFQGVESSYAIQAGRELRIVINPDKVSDDEATIMSREVAKKIEDTMQYPGQIKVTILRETRAVEYAR